MTPPASHRPTAVIQPFDRARFDSGCRFTTIGDGSLGGKAQGLASIWDTLHEALPPNRFPRVAVTIPSMTVLCTDIFDQFMEQNNLWSLDVNRHRDEEIASRFLAADLPPTLVGDLRALVSHILTPLAIRSSSLLEDALYRPFAGIYTTKMIPNNQFDLDTRFRRLTEAIKFVYASTFFASARLYRAAIDKTDRDEKMAVIIQQVVGTRFGDRFYPHLSGVARTFNYYAMGDIRPDQRVVSLALGLGKTVVDGEKCWTYSPEHPDVVPPTRDIDELLDNSQTEFWAVNMGTPPMYDPFHETEYLMRLPVRQAEEDGTLRFVASTYLPAEERMVSGIERSGPRLLDFAAILRYQQLPITDIVKVIMSVCETTLGSSVEVEFAVQLDNDGGVPATFGFLQVRPMVVAATGVTVTSEDLVSADTLIASENCLGNGENTDVRDIVLVDPERFSLAKTAQVAAEIAEFNRRLLSENRPFLLIGFGRWGSADPWLGIPVDWGQIAGARAIVEATLPSVAVEISQGSHFFHNLSSFGTFYFCVPHHGPYRIDWGWLCGLPCESMTDHVRHIRLDCPLRVRVDGRSARGVIQR